MEKKLTKKEMELLEKERKAKRTLKQRMISDLESYWADVSAFTRVARINDNKEMLDFYGDLKKEEADKLFIRYESLQGLTDIQISAIRTLIYNRDNIKESRTRETLPENAIWIDDIIWKEEDLDECIELFKKIGIEKIYYTDSSTACLRVVVWMTKRNIKIVGTTNISEYREGLVFEL